MRWHAVQSCIRFIIIKPPIISLIIRAHGISSFFSLHVTELRMLRELLLPSTCILFSLLRLWTIVTTTPMTTKFCFHTTVHPEFAASLSIHTGTGCSSYGAAQHRLQCISTTYATQVRNASGEVWTYLQTDMMHLPVNFGYLRSQIVPRLILPLSRRVRVRDQVV